MSQAQRRAYWMKQLEEQERSGLKVSGYCAEKGLKAWQFYAWRRRLREEESEERSFTQLGSTWQVSALQVRAPNGIVVEASACCSTQLLSTTLDWLKEAGRCSR